MKRSRRSVESARPRIHAHRFGGALRLRRERDAHRQVLSSRRSEFILVTKGGMFRNAQGQREIDGRPEMIRKNCEESLQRLKTDVIDLYYLHRWDKRLPIEESVGALADLVKEGKVKTIGLRRSRRRRCAGRTPCIRSRRCRPSIRCGRATPRSPCSTPAASSASRSSRSARWRAASSVASSATCPRFRRKTFAWRCRVFRASTSRGTSRCSTGCPPSLASRAARWRKRARLGPGAGPAHHPDSGDDAARSPRRERARGAGAPLPCRAREAERVDQPLDRLGRALQPHGAAGNRYRGDRHCKRELRKSELTLDI